MEKNNKRTYALITLCLLGVILLVIGISYAYWILTKEQTGENVVNSACLNIDIESESDDITLDKTYPILDSEGRKLKPYKFSVHNKCGDMATYQINLESLTTVLEANRLNPNYIKVKLNVVGEEGIEKVLGETSPTDTTIENTYEAHKLMSGYLEANETKNFELRIWVHEKVTVENADSMNKEFKSKITVTSTYINEDDVPPTSELALSVCDDTITATATASAYKNKSISKYEYQIDEEDWQDGKTTQEFTNQIEGEHTIKLRVTDNLGATSEVEQTINTTLEKVEIAGKQIPIATCKNGLYKVEHNDLEELDNAWNKIEYRYAGVNYTSSEAPYVHNYVEFNNELWRIIGLVNVKVGDSVEQRLKIVRTDGIANQKDFGRYAWDRRYDYTNNWTTSKLKDMLNGIYYESGIGECCIDGDYSYCTQTTCDFKTGTELPKGLDDTAREMIDKEVIWNLGGWEDSEITANQFYEKERGTTVYNTDRPTEWSSTTDVGEKHNGIGLIYPSDYGYAVGGEVRNNCLTKNLYNYNKDNCSTNDWLKLRINMDNNFLWTLSPYSTSSEYVFGVYIDGFIHHDDNFLNYALAVWPTAYLTKNVTITSGEGTMEQPYQLQLNS